MLQVMLRSMLRPTRLTVRALAAVLAVAVTSLVALTFSSAPAYACSCKGPGTFAKQLRQADTVMVGRLEHVQEADSEAADAEAAEDGTQTLHVVATRVFKGTLEQARVQVESSNAGSCSWYDPESDAQLLFVVRDGRADLCTGSREASAGTVQRVQRQLGVGERMAPPPPPEATRTKVETQEPEEFTRLAAPGGAAVLLGLLGLAVVGRLNRN